MKTAWIKHVKTKEEKQKVYETLVNSKYLRDILTNILESELKEKENSKEEDYKIPNWSCYQADRNGYKRALKSFIQLLNLKEDLK